MRLNLAYRWLARLALEQGAAAPLAPMRICLPAAAPPSSAVPLRWQATLGESHMLCTLFTL